MGVSTQLRGCEATCERLSGANYAVTCVLDNSSRFLPSGLPQLAAFELAGTQLASNHRGSLPSGSIYDVSLLTWQNRTAWLNARTIRLV